MDEKFRLTELRLNKIQDKIKEKTEVIKELHQIDKLKIKNRYICFIDGLNSCREKLINEQKAIMEQLISEINQISYEETALKFVNNSTTFEIFEKMVVEMFEQKINKHKKVIDSCSNQTLDYKSELFNAKLQLPFEFSKLKKYYYFIYTNRSVKLKEHGLNIKCLKSTHIRYLDKLDYFFILPFKKIFVLADVDVSLNKMLIINYEGYILHSRDIGQVKLRNYEAFKASTFYIIYVNENQARIDRYSIEIYDFKLNLLNMFTIKECLGSDVILTTKELGIQLSKHNIVTFYDIERSSIATVKCKFSEYGVNKPSFYVLAHFDCLRIYFFNLYFQNICVFDRESGTQFAKISCASCSKSVCDSNDMVRHEFLASLFKSDSLSIKELVNWIKIIEKTNPELFKNKMYSILASPILNKRLVQNEIQFEEY